MLPMPPPLSLLEEKVRTCTGKNTAGRITLSTSFVDLNILDRAAKRESILSTR